MIQISKKEQVKLKQKKRQTLLLLKNQLSFFKQNYKFLLITVSLILISLIFDISSTILLNKNSPLNEKHNLITIFILINSILWSLFSIWLTIDILKIQFKNNIHKIELRYGFHLFNIYFSRIIFILGFFSLFVIFNFIISLIFGFANNISDILVYRFFISAYAWYAIELLLTIAITILLVQFTSEVLSSILATVLVIFGLLLPFVTGFVLQSKESSINPLPDPNVYFYLYKQDLTKEWKSFLETDSESQKIYDDYDEFIKTFSSIGQQEKNIVGLQIWTLDNPDVVNQMPKYSTFMNKADEIIKQSNFSQWDDFSEFTHQTFESKTPLVKIIKQLNKNQEFKKIYSSMLGFLTNLASNETILREYEILFSPSYDSLFWNQQYLDKVQNLYTSDQWAFTKFVNSIFYNVESFDLSNSIASDNDIIGSPYLINDSIKQVTKLEKINNMFNPFHHLSLMFSSINYQKPVLDIVFNASQNFYGGIGNLNYQADSLENPSIPLNLHRVVYVEGLYIFYFLLGLLIIWLSYLKFHRQIKP